MLLKSTPGASERSHLLVWRSNNVTEQAEPVQRSGFKGDGLPSGIYRS